MIPALNPCIVAHATEAWCQTYRHITDRGDLGPYLGETADEVIERVAPLASSPALWRAYEKAVHDAAVARLGLDGAREGLATGPSRKRTGLAPGERAEIIRRLERGQPPREIARALRRSIPLVYRVRKEMSA